MYKFLLVTFSLMAICSISVAGDRTGNVFIQDVYGVGVDRLEVIVSEIDNPGACESASPYVFYSQDSMVVNAMYLRLKRLMEYGRQVSFELDGCDVYPVVKLVIVE